MSAAEYWFDSHDGLRLFSRVYAGPAAGSPVVVCLHGLMRNSRDFEDLAAHLARRYRVIVPDMRGRGLSARDPNFNNYQLPVYLKDVLMLLTGLGAARVTIIGTSMGGLMAMLLAATQPALVAGIVLNDVGPEVDRAGLERIRGYAGKAAPVRSWAEAVALVRSVYGSALPGLSDERWEKMARQSYRADAQGVPQADADPLIGEPLRNSDSAAPDLWPTSSLNSTPSPGGRRSTLRPTRAMNGYGGSQSDAPSPASRSMQIGVVSANSASSPKSVASVSWTTSFCTSPYRDTAISPRRTSWRRAIRGSCSAS
jgi:pimeloyl-ACP methyl ester carboxylesterase